MDIISLIVLLLLIISLGLIFKSSNNYREGYESYDTCIAQGYASDFCLQVPVQSVIS